MRQLPECGLYAITDAALCARWGLAQAVELALRGGAGLLQYRDKSTDGARRRHEADALARMCRSYATPFIVNDDIDLARACGADGVHVGADDASVASARAAMGDGAIIGVSCYDSLALARMAEREGASYVAFGSVYPSPTKPNAVAAGLDLIVEARASLEIPITAIGGITTQNAPPLLDAGADYIAVIHAVFGSDDPQGAARQLAALFHHSMTSTR